MIPPVLPLDDEDLALLCKALAHPARVAIARSLAATACRCGEIVEALPLAQSTVSQHLKVMREAGLVAGTVEGPRTCYGLDRAALARLADALSAIAQDGCCGAVPALVEQPADT